VNKQKTTGCSHSEWGFSLIELMVVIGLIMTIAAIAVIQLPASLQNARTDTAMREVVDQLRQAREYSIANRRYVQITFPVVAGQYEVQMTQMDTCTAGAGGANPILSTVPIQVPMQYFVFAALGDTPDGYGNAAAIYFGNANGGPLGGMYFQSDGELGTLTGCANFQAINGTVFLGVPGNATTARAVTVLGTTGRVRGWKHSGAAWVQF
jgi:type II secretory pathway pseudopilin PulG